MKVNSFSTDRFRVKDWRPHTVNRADRKVLEASLSSILTQPVLANLPPSLQVKPDEGGIASWIDDRNNESIVLIVEPKTGKELTGLMILAPCETYGGKNAVHIGYLLSEAAWGKGVATELVKGLISHWQNPLPVRLVGGVNTANPASARVLQRAGFIRDPNLSTSELEIYTLDID